MGNRRQRAATLGLAVVSLALVATGTAVAVADPFPQEPSGPPVAPTVRGPDQVLPPFGQELALTGTARPYTEVTVWADRRGPELAAPLTTLRAEADGNWRVEFTPDDDYTIFVQADGFLSRNILLTPSPVLEAPRVRYVPRETTVPVGGQGTPGSRVLVSFREPGAPEQVYDNALSVTVGPDSRWTLPLFVADDRQFRVQRTPTGPASPPVVIKAPYGPEVTAVQAALREAVELDSWPEDLEPKIVPGVPPPFVTPEIARCAAVGPLPEQCVRGPEDATKTAVLVGDSLAVSYVESLRPILAEAGWRFYPYATSGCTFTAPTTFSSSPRVERLCPAKKEEAIAAIEELQPDVVFVTNVYGGRLVLGQEEPLDGAAWYRATLPILERIEDDAGEIVLLAPPPINKDVTECYEPEGSPQACLGGVPAFWQDIAAAERRLADAVDGTWIDTRPLYCLADGRCPAVVGTTTVKTDQAHLSQTYARVIVAALAELLQDADVL